MVVTSMILTITVEEEEGICRAGAGILRLFIYVAVLVMILGDVAVICCGGDEEI